jgi:acetyltransferase-like isoleucine patch superfamily enzyme
VQIREGAVLGQDCIVSKGAYIDTNVVLGDNVKVQNEAQVYSPAIIESGVFIGPGAILTNDHYPRAVNPSGELKANQDWNKEGVRVETGASIGAGVICVAPLVIGSWSMIGAGSVVTRSTMPFGLYVGTPAKRIGWVGKSGLKLTRITDNRYCCPQTGCIYIEESGTLVEESST